MAEEVRPDTRSVLIVGDSFLDVLIPVEQTIEAEEALTYKCSNAWAAPGGAANVCQILRQLAPDWEVKLLWPYSEFDAVAQMWDLITFDNMTIPLCGYQANLQMRIRLENHHGRICRIDCPPPERPLNYGDDDYWDELREIIHRPWDAIVIADHGYMPDLVADIFELSLSKEPNTCIFYDGNTKTPPPVSEKPINAVYKFNEVELAQWPYVKGLVRHIIETRGRAPTRYHWLDENGQVMTEEFPVPAIIEPKQWQYSGAGDAFVAAMVYYIARCRLWDATILRPAIGFAQRHVLQYMSLWRRRYVLLW